MATAQRNLAVPVMNTGQDQAAVVPVAVKAATTVTAAMTVKAATTVPLGMVEPAAGTRTMPEPTDFSATPEMASLDTHALEIHAAFSVLTMDCSATEPGVAMPPVQELTVEMGRMVRALME